MPPRLKFSSKFNWVNERGEGRFREVRQWVYRKVRPRGTLGHVVSLQNCHVRRLSGY
jgi:hypothetical protein